MLLALANELATTQIQPPGNLSVENTKKAATGILLVVISLVLGWLTLKSLLGDAKSGNYKGVANVAIASVLAMIPLSLGAYVTVARGYGAAIVNFFGSVIS